MEGDGNNYGPPKWLHSRRQNPEHSLLSNPWVLMPGAHRKVKAGEDPVQVPQPRELENLWNGLESPQALGADALVWRGPEWETETFYPQSRAWLRWPPHH